MNCYNHSEKDAVVLCKICYKSLCKDCETILHNGSACRNPACRNQCEVIVKLLDNVSMTSKKRVADEGKIFNKSSKIYFSISLYTSITGIIFVLVGFYLPFIFSEIKPILFGILPGLVFFIIAYLNYLNGKDLRQFQEGKAQ